MLIIFTCDLGISGTWAGSAVSLQLVIWLLGVQSQVTNLSVQLLQLTDETGIPPPQTVLVDTQKAGLYISYSRTNIWQSRSQRGPYTEQSERETQSGSFYRTKKCLTWTDDLKAAKEPADLQTSKPRTCWQPVYSRITETRSAYSSLGVQELDWD